MTKTAKDILTKKVVLVKKESSFYSVVKLFEDRGISAAIVIDDNKKLCGIATKSDILSFYIDEKLTKNFIKGPGKGSDNPAKGQAAGNKSVISEVMTPNPISAQEDTPIKNIAEMMLSNGIHKVVIKKGESVVGIVSANDFLLHVSGAPKNG